MVPSLSSLRLITVDFTGTVFRFRRPPFSVYTEVSAKHGVFCDERDVQRGFYKAWKKSNSLDPHFGAKTDGDSKRWWCQVIEDTFQEALGPKYSHHDNYPIAEELYKTYSTSSNYELFPDALQFLESIQRLRKDGNITVGALTNFDRRIHDVVKLLGLSSKLDFVLCSEDAKSSKPESDIFLAGLKCASRHGTEGPIDAREILHIGDDIANDYEGARRVGWNALLINRKNGDAISGVDSAHICRDFNVVARKLGLEIK